MINLVKRYIVFVLWLCALSNLGLGQPISVSAQSSSYQPSLPRLAPPETENNDKLAQPVEPRNVPDFPAISRLTPGIGTNYSAAKRGEEPCTAAEQHLGDAARASRCSSSGYARRDEDSGRRAYKDMPDGSAAAALVEAAHTKRGTALQGEAASTTLPVKTRMKLVLETRVDAKTSKPGDIFEGHVRDDLFVGTSLLLPRGSLIRGRIAAVNKPRIISRAAKIGLKLDEIVTPTGEVIPLDAALEFQKGVANEKGQLDPGTNFGTRVGSEIRAVSGADSQGAAKGALVAANVATLGIPTIATAIGGSAIALFRSGDNVDLGPGQEIEIILTDNLGLQIN